MSKILNLGKYLYKDPTDSSGPIPKFELDKKMIEYDNIT